MTFTVYSLDGFEIVPPSNLFKKQGVEKAGAIAKVQPVRRKKTKEERRPSIGRGSPADIYTARANSAVQSVAITADQVMSVPVVTVTPEATVTEALQLLQENGFRHVPVVSSAGGPLVGILSERDILRYLADLPGTDQPEGAMARLGAPVDQVMTPHILTAECSTDLRFITRLFVERRIGAMPIVDGHIPKGIITRSDILSAVVRHYVLELWA